jgi:HTH-type transcriptional regulator / antitoxin HigA
VNVGCGIQIRKIYMSLTIRSETEYEAALERMNELWGAEPNSQEGAELNTIFRAIEEYENQHYPIDEPKSFAAIEFHLDRLNLSIDQLPLSQAEKELLELLLSRELMVPESLLIKLSGILGVQRETLGRAASQDYVAGSAFHGVHRKR